MRLAVAALALLELLLAGCPACEPAGASWRDAAMYRALPGPGQLGPFHSAFDANVTIDDPMLDARWASEDHRLDSVSAGPDGEYGPRFALLGRDVTVRFPDLSAYEAARSDVLAFLADLGVPGAQAEAFRQELARNETRVLRGVGNVGGKASPPWSQFSGLLPATARGPQVAWDRLGGLSGVADTDDGLGSVRLERADWSFTFRVPVKGGGTAGGRINADVDGHVQFAADAYEGKLGDMPEWMRNELLTAGLPAPPARSVELSASTC